MYTYLYPAKVLYIHNPKYFYLKVDVWPGDLHYKVNLNLSLEAELWAEWEDPEAKKSYLDFLVKALRNKVVFVSVSPGDRVNIKPQANLYVPSPNGNVVVNSHPCVIYPHFLEAWKAGDTPDVTDLSSVYRM